MSALQGIEVNPSGQTVVVRVTETGGGTPVLYADQTAIATLPNPSTITQPTTFYLSDPAVFTVSCKSGGNENANGSGGTVSIDLTGGGVASITVPVPVQPTQTENYIGFYGATPVARQSVPAAAVDAASTQALTNSLRTALINLGLVQ